MCVLIIKKSGSRLPKKEILDACMYGNHQGFGFATQNRVFKTLDYKAFLRALKSIRVKDNAIIHFRLASVGSVNESNAHPFTYNNLAFAHNGTLPIAPIKGKTDSETAFLKYIVPVVENFGFNSEFVDDTVNSIIGSSKFALLDRVTGNLSYWGNFTEIDGNLYSNTYWQYYERYSVFSNYGKSFRIF